MGLRKDTCKATGQLCAAVTSACPGLPTWLSFRLYQEYQSNVYRGSINLTNNATGKHVENTDLLESYFPDPWSRDVHRLGSFLSTLRNKFTETSA